MEEEEAERAKVREEERKKRIEEGKRRAQLQREQDQKRAKKQPQQKSGEKKVSTNEAGRIGDRPYARGRSYQENRYEEKES
jgi:YidC/Oxa1 family membrane protein insertase